ncbi:MAG: DUF1549 domain-containing protein [Pirellulales bacterium]
MPCFNRIRRILLSLLLAVAGSGMAVGGLASADESLVLLPASITLTGPSARQGLLVERKTGELFTGQVTEGVAFSSSDANVVQIVDGAAVPVSNGQATITATVGGRTATAEVMVVQFEQPFQWSFRNHVESVLTKTGCNAGACHGAQAGKKGFKLSLRGYDPDGDFQTLTRQARGRRIVPGDPGRSLLLTKPTAAVPHGGGIRMEVGSLEYRALAEWIAAGTPPPVPADPRLHHLELLPPGVVLKPGMDQQLIVRAHFTDGHVEDVTRWAKYVSTNQSVAAVDDDGGVIHVMGHGEGAVTAWYLSQMVTASVTSPYEAQVAAEVFAQAPRRNFIDEQILAKLQSLNLPPSPPANDGEFLRRAFLDTIGTLPTADETRAFLADTSSDKRDRMIDSLLARAEFVDYWTYKWSDLLLVNGDKLRPPAMWAYYDWIRNQVAANTPWDQFARQLVTASGSTLENGATNYFVLHQDPADLAETTSLTFMGLSIGCAKCHNHPLEKWTNNQYFGMANLFARVRSKDANGDGHRVIFAATEGELVQPLTGKPQPPQPLDGVALPFESTEDRRLHLADWLVSPDNPYFARSITNRVWANFFGAGLVENVDDLRLTNPASNAALLNAAAAHLVEHKFDLKSLMRTILQSAAYQRSSQPLPENQADSRYYARYYPRRLMAEVLLDAVSQVSGAPTRFPGYPAEWRAMQLPDANISSYFLKTFGRPDRVITCECERTAEPSMVQVLHISNGDTINLKLEAAGNRIDQMLQAGTPDDKIIEELYLSALSRLPTASEQADVQRTLAESGEANKRILLEDVYWGVLSSREFLFNH